MSTLLGKNAKARGKKEHEQTEQDGVSNPDTGQAGSEKEEKGPGDCRVCAGRKNGVSAGAESVSPGGDNGQKRNPLRASSADGETAEGEIG